MMPNEKQHIFGLTQSVVERMYNSVSNFLVRKYDQEKKELEDVVVRLEARITELEKQNTMMALEFSGKIFVVTFPTVFQVLQTLCCASRHCQVCLCSIVLSQNK